MHEIKNFLKNVLNKHLEKHKIYIIMDFGLKVRKLLLPSLTLQLAMDAARRSSFLPRNALKRPHAILSISFVENK